MTKGIRNLQTASILVGIITPAQIGVVGIIN
jgi:hypothetical protein